jgi:hypothetical protein
VGWGGGGFIISFKKTIYLEQMMQLHTGAEHFGNILFRNGELTSQYYFDASIDVNRM